MGKKVVLDTNVLVSSLAWEGNPKRILEEIIKGNLELIISQKQFNELSRVLDYPKFGFTKEQKNRFKTLILKISTLIKTKSNLEIIKEDHDDNAILEAALEGKADFIITGDNHLLKLKKFKNIRIVNPSSF